MLSSYTTPFDYDSENDHSETRSSVHGGASHGLMRARNQKSFSRDPGSIGAAQSDALVLDARMQAVRESGRSIVEVAQALPQVLCAQG